MTLHLVPESHFVSHVIDWLQYTAKWRDNDVAVGAVWRAVPHHPKLQPTGERGKNIRGMNQCVLLGIGSAHYHSEHPEFGISVQFTGDDMATLYAEEIHPLVILGHIGDIGAKVTRLDFAVDLRNTGANPLDFRAELLAGNVITQARKTGLYEGHDKSPGAASHSVTVYLGSSTSIRQIRIYDKAAQMRQSGDWKRIELVCRDEAAEALHKLMLQQGISEAGKAALLDMADCDLDWWKEATENAGYYMAAGVKRDRATEVWLTTTVAGVLRSVLITEQQAGKDNVRKVFEAILRGEQVQL